MGFIKNITRKQVTAIFLIAVVTFAASFAYSVQKASAALLSSASIQLSDSRPSQTGVTYITTFTFPATTSIKCIDIIIGDSVANIVTTPNPATTAPAVLDTTSGAKVSVTGGGLTDGSWTLYNTTNGVLQYENSSGEASTATQIVITTSTITNTSAATFYAQVATYSTLSTHTCSTRVDTSNFMALVTTAGVTTSVTVDPSLTFSVANYGSAVNGSGSTGLATTTSTTVPFGTVAANADKAGSQTLTTSTNAAHGYTLYVRYTGILTDTNADTFRTQAGTPGSPLSFDGSSSQSSFGYTTDSDTVVFGSDQWAGLTTTNTSIHTKATAQNANAIHVEYKVHPSNVQPPGTYSTTITYTATPSY
jgi:hypothetical protein